MANKNKIQYGNFNLVILIGRFFARYEIKCSNTKNPIIAIGYFCDIIKGIEFSVKKSKNTNFCMLTSIKFGSGIKNGIQNKNIIYWGKPITSTMNFFKIYKESTQSGIYNLIGTRPYDSLSYFVDITSQPKVKEARYKLSVMDSCSNESILSNVHKTMLLQVSLGVPADHFVLDWTPYEGFNFSTYRLWRGVQNQQPQLIDSIQSSLTHYNDYAVPNGNIYYFIEVVSPKN